MNGSVATKSVPTRCWMWGDCDLLQWTEKRVVAIVVEFPNTVIEPRAMGSDENQNAFMIAAAAALFIIAVGAYFAHSDDRSSSGFDDATTHTYAKETDLTPTSGAGGAPAADSVDLSDSQLASVKVEPAGEYVFSIEKEAVGSIDFNQEMSVQVFTPYQGRIVGLFATIGDEVKKGQTLFTIDSPGDPVRTTAVPRDGVVREGDGHHDDVGHRRSPAFHPADCQDRLAT